MLKLGVSFHGLRYMAFSLNASSFVDCIPRFEGISNFVCVYVRIVLILLLEI